MAGTLAARTAYVTGQRNPPRTAAVAVHAHASQHGRGAVCSATKRELMLGSSCSLAAALLSTAAPALAFTSPPPGFTRHLDRLDGYSFFYPESWQIVTTSGNDVFYRNPRIADENVFVDISSPSSSRYTSVAQLGSPEQASDRVIRQLKKESMSTRLGVQREFETLSATERTADDGQLYYDIVSRVKSYASRQQLAVTDAERQDAMVLEFDRVLINTIGTANMRLYQLRIQTPYSRYTKAGVSYQEMMDSFKAREVV